MTRRTRTVALAGAVAAAAAVALPALAQDKPATDAKVTVTPNDAGTPRHPQPVEIGVVVGPFELDPADAPVVDKGTILLGKGFLWNGAKHPTCTATILNDEGLGGCPKMSIVGRLVSGNLIDGPKQKITVVNGGAKRAFAYVQMTVPARVNVAVPVHIEKRNRKWAYEIGYDMPPSLQIVAGVPISLTNPRGRIGKGKILATTFCPRDRKWRYRSTTTLLDGRVIKHAGTTPCRR